MSPSFSMQKYLSHIVGWLIAITALYPPMDFEIAPPMQWYPWMLVLAGFLGFYTLVLDVAVGVKIVAIGGFLNCFFSSTPYISFISYMLLIAGCYFYILCSRVTDYKPVYKILQCLVFFNAFMVVMQLVKQDVLLNFGLDHTLCFGVTGQHMQTASFSVVLAAALFPFQRFNILFAGIISAFCNSLGGFLSIASGLFISLLNPKRIKIAFIFLYMSIILIIGWGLSTHKFSNNLDSKNGRLATWEKSIEIANQHYLMGWGIGSFKYVFPAMQNNPYSIKWVTAHNCWIQFLFETGRMGFLLIAGYFVYLFYKLIKLVKRSVFRKDAVACLAGLTMIAVNMMVHFPTRMVATSLILIFFISVCQRTVNKNGAI